MNSMNKMIMAVIPRDEATQVIDQLVLAGHTATFTASRGGVLRQAQQILFIAVSQTDLPQVLAIIRQNCRAQVHVEAAAAPEEQTAANPVWETAEVGGAVIFVWDLAHFEVVSSNNG